MAKSLKFSMVCGVNEGYAHENEKYNSLELLSYGWAEVAEKVFNETGIYVSATIVESRTIYHQDWGCPKGGEVTATCFGSANPNFVTDMAAWKEAVIMITKKLKKDFKQSTVTVEFNEIDHVYLT